MTLADIWDVLCQVYPHSSIRDITSLSPFLICLKIWFKYFPERLILVNEVQIISVNTSAAEAYYSDDYATFLSLSLHLVLYSKCIISAVMNQSTRHWESNWMN